MVGESCSIEKTEAFNKPIEIDDGDPIAEATTILARVPAQLPCFLNMLSILADYPPLMTLTAFTASSHRHYT